MNLIVWTDEEIFYDGCNNHDRPFDILQQRHREFSAS